MSLSAVSKPARPKASTAVPQYSKGWDCMRVWCVGAGGAQLVCEGGGRKAAAAGRHSTHGVGAQLRPRQPLWQLAAGGARLGRVPVGAASLPLHAALVAARLLLMCLSTPCHSG